MHVYTLYKVLARFKPLSVQLMGVGKFHSLPYTILNFTDSFLLLAKVG